MKLIKSSNHFTPAELSKMSHSSLIDLNQILKENILASPIEKKSYGKKFGGIIKESQVYKKNASN